MLIFNNGRALVAAIRACMICCGIVDRSDAKYQSGGIMIDHRGFVIGTDGRRLCVAQLTEKPRCTDDVIINQHAAEWISDSFSCQVDDSEIGCSVSITLGTIPGRAIIGCGDESLTGSFLLPGIPPPWMAVIPKEVKIGIGHLSSMFLGDIGEIAMEAGTVMNGRANVECSISTCGDGEGPSLFTWTAKYGTVIKYVVMPLKKDAE